MKRHITMITTAMMTMSVLMAPAVWADETEATIVNTPDNPVTFDYHDVDDTVFEGQWWDTGLGFDICVPADWVDADLTEEMAEAGVVHIYGEDGGGANCTIVCTEIPEEEAAAYDIERLGNELAPSATTLLYADLSGIPAVVFENDETCVSGSSMLSDDGYLIQGVITAPSDEEYEEYGPVFANITTSISPTVSGEESTEASTEG